MFKFILFALLSLQAFANDHVTTNSFAVIENKALEFGEKYNPAEVLLVFDIDNTLLAMPQNFGSDQWFTWQYSNCIGKTKRYFCTTNDMGELLDLQGKLFAASKMQPTEKLAPEVIKNLQAKGFKTIALTSRGPEFRNSTERELKRNNFIFVDHAIGPKAGYPGLYIPFEADKLSAAGLSKADKRIARIRKNSRPVSFMNGIMMTSGMNKGLMLKTLLHKTGFKPKAVVFVDDHSKHTIRMQRILGRDESMDLATFRYSRLDAQVEEFNSGNKKKVIKAFNLLSKTFNEVFAK